MAAGDDKMPNPAHGFIHGDLIGTPVFAEIARAHLLPVSLFQSLNQPLRLRPTYVDNHHFRLLQPDTPE